MTATGATTTANGPLAGYRIIDLSAVLSGPMATQILADQGADVIKVEPPGLGDVVRYFGSSRGGMSGFFATVNRGKRGVVINLSETSGKALLAELVATADVFVQNFRPGVAERMGIGADELMAANPRLVYASISGFGEDGPLAGKRVYDNVVQGYSAMASVQGDPLTGEPQLLRQAVCDKVTAITAAQAITSALLARDRPGGTGSGQHVRLAMLDAAVAFLWPDAAMSEMLLGDGVAATPPLSSFYRVGPSADGWITGSALSDQEFAALCEAVERPDLATDERFASIGARLVNGVELVETLAELTAKYPTGELIERMDRTGAPCAPLVTLADLPSTGQVEYNQIFTVTEHPVAGALREARPAARFSGTPVATGAPAPTLGQHTDAVLTELGYDASAIADLRAAGAVG